MTNNIEYKFALHVLMWNCDKFILRMIENCGPYVEKIYVAYSTNVWSYNPKAKNIFHNSTKKNILENSKYFEKIEIIEGEWETEVEQRNACLQKAKDEGFDFLIIHDADEFYKNADYQNNFKEIIQNPDFDIYQMPWCTFWKSLEYIIETKSGEFIDGYQNFAINCKKDILFNRARGTNAKSVFKLSGVCFHLSYVNSDDEIYSKINTWGHSSEFNREKWFKNKWLKWNENTKDLHPLLRGLWVKAVKYQGTLPEVLCGFENPEYHLYQPSIIDKLIEYKEISIIYIHQKISLIRQYLT
jgi:uncharacterized protein (UPF0335 family)